MNQYHFAVRNILDKLIKMTGDWTLVRFYWKTYVSSMIDSIEPDVYVVSYPKCGRTWLRVMLKNYLKVMGFPSPLFNDRSIMGFPDGQTVKFEHDQGNWVPAPFRIERLRFNTAKYHNKKVVFLFRDPRDVLVSSWYHLKYRERIYRKGLSAFIRDDLVGIHKVVAFMNMWIDSSNRVSDFYLLTYEQLQVDPLFRFGELLDFMGVTVSPGALQEAVKASSFDKMQEIETQGSLNEPWMKAGAKNAERSMKIRKGKVRGFYEELAENDLQFLDNVIQNDLSSKLIPYCC